MAVAAHIRYLLAIIQCEGVFDIVCCMTVYAYRYVLILLIKKGLAMYTLYIYIIYSCMTLLAPAGYEYTFLGEMRYLMRSMAVGANRSIKVPLAQYHIMDAVHCFCVLIKMAAPACI